MEKQAADIDSIKALLEDVAVAEAAKAASAVDSGVGVGVGVSVEEEGAEGSVSVEEIAAYRAEIDEVSGYMNHTTTVQLYHWAPLYTA